MLYVAESKFGRNLKMGFEGVGGRGPRAGNMNGLEQLESGWRPV